ncbi:unnamed protein product [Vitrella brassicaformis CCMP3155]|uniref:Uncharacterized protein n=1 Tax=Vitrella brassicaformis (strain CCMP3155) TaxID=1169540 RepID=A0A0G4FEE1_VITBC|nr:unnamed protein product [Vitrella brassicaformis CCMP3155]|eukprot:CEM11326.1 unnamed protein product [Vitrella brassicaformis CCMP3155]
MDSHINHRTECMSTMGVLVPNILYYDIALQEGVMYPWNDAIARKVEGLVSAQRGGAAVKVVVDQWNTG